VRHRFRVYPRARAGGQALGLAADRSYAETYWVMTPAERERSDRIDVVAIVTPNHMHHPAARAFLDAGIHVICDKPMTTTPDEADDLVERVQRTGLVFVVTYNYTGYPMVRQARALAEAGEIGEVRLVQVEYAQDWLAMPIERAPLEAAGHAEGYPEALATLYAETAELIWMQTQQQSPAARSLLPTVADGARGIRFIAAAIESGRCNSAWVPV